MDDEAKPYLLTEASGLTGLSVDALRKRIERKKLRGTRSNEDGQWRVWLTSKDVETAKSGQPVDKSGQGMDGLPDESRIIKALDDRAATLEAALDRERTRADRAEAAAAEARALAGRRLQGGAELRERAGRAEGELEALRRPFWRRWLG